MRRAAPMVLGVTLALTTALVTLAGAPAQAAACTATPAALGAVRQGVAGYSGEQLDNAAIIMRTGVTLGLGTDAQTLAVMTAMGESTLRNLPYGDDAINPDGSVADSVGLFQQQHFWGSLADRMTPAKAATAFYHHLVAVRDWRAMTPTAAAHAVQGNLDPAFYARFHPSAVEVVAALAPAVQAGAGSCPAPAPPVVDPASTTAGAKAPSDTKAAPTVLGDAGGAIGEGLVDGLSAVGGTLPDAGAGGGDAG